MTQTSIDDLESKMDALNEVALQEEAELLEAASAAMENQSVKDQFFFRVTGTDRIVQTEEEYNSLTNTGIPLQLVSYNQAIACFERRQIKGVRKKQARAKQKRARQARKVNRGRR